MELTNKFIEAGAWMLENGHRAALKVTGGRWPKTVLGMEPVELHTTGRTSGLPRSTMLSAPIYGENRVVVIASKGGHERDPDWYRNLVAEPNIEITARGRTVPMTARTATAKEKAELWPTITAAYKGYEGYQQRTDRDIPVVICEPR